MELFRYESVLVRDPFDPSRAAEAVRLSYPAGPGVGLVRRGKVRDIYLDGAGRLIFLHTDRISAFDVVMPDLVPYKGVFLNKLSAYWFRRSSGVFPNHFVEEVGDRAFRGVRAERIDIEWVVRGYLYGSAWRAYSKGVRRISGVELPSGLQLAEELPEPVLTPTTKSDTGHDVEISREEAISRRLVARDEWRELEEASLRLYEFYRSEARARGVIVADAKFEFGRLGGSLIQIDEPPTHDSARLWSEKHYSPGRYQESHCLDKEFLRAYLARTGYSGSGPPPRLPQEIIDQVALRVRGAYEVIAGKADLESLGLESLEEVMARIGGAPRP